MTKATLLGSRGLRARKQVEVPEQLFTVESGLVHPHRLENFRKILVPDPQPNPRNVNLSG